MKKIFSYLSILVLFFSCSPNNVDRAPQLEKYFTENNAKGCFALYNNSTNKFTIHNLESFRDSSYSPTSTFNIVSSLIGLQEGVIVDDSMIVKWDGVHRPIENWNQDLSMFTAFRIEAQPYYQEISRRIGKERIKIWLDTLAYGSKKITTSIDSFWFDNSLKITPDEQLGFLKKLYFHQLPFHQRNHEIVKGAMLFENNTKYKLSYTTGLEKNNNEKQVTWMIGWIEENNHPYFFVLHFETSENPDSIPQIRLKLLMQILKDLGFLEGKM